MTDFKPGDRVIYKRNPKAGPGGDARHNGRTGTVTGPYSSDGGMLNVDWDDGTQDITPWSYNLELNFRFTPATPAFKVGDRVRHTVTKVVGTVANSRVIAGRLAKVDWDEAGTYTMANPQVRNLELIDEPAATTEYEADSHLAVTNLAVTNVAPDVVAHPSHYADGRKYEPKDVIRDWGLNFNRGSVVKYVSRAGRKANELEDLRKARQFLDFEIEALEAEAN